MITGRHRFLPTDPPYAARKQHHRKILLSSRFIIVVTLFIYRLKSCTSSTAWLTAPQKESFACSKLRVRKHEHENKTGGNWGEKGPPPFFYRSRTHIFACLSLTRYPYYLRAWNRLQKMRPTVPHFLFSLSFLHSLT